MARNVSGDLKVLPDFADKHHVGDLGEMMPGLSRQPVVFDHASMRLSIGDKWTRVPDLAAGNEVVLRSYLALVAEVRGTPIGSGIEVRHDDVVVLAEILDLSDADLELHLANLLGVSANDAADVHRRIRRHRAFALSFAAALGSIGIVGAGNISAASPAPARSAVVTSVPGDVPATTAGPASAVIVAGGTSVSTDDTTDESSAAVVDDTAPSATAPVAEAPTETPSADDVQILDALVIERGVQPADPDTQIGDSVTYER
jgi:hypothetical protein